MRIKRLKCNRRIVKFYASCFGFHEPYKVLCDGTFIHHIVVNGIQIAPYNDAVSKLLGAKTKLFTTNCILGELKSLGASHLESLKFAQQLTIARCDHEKRKNAVACSIEIVRENKQEHFFVATVDADLREQLREIPCVPVIYGLRKALYLEPPSNIQHQFVKSAEQKRLHMTDFEYKLLNKSAKNTLATVRAKNFNEAIDDKDQDLKTFSVGMKSMDGKDRPHFKRNKAKGPNPLSCKKKKKKASNEEFQQNLAANKMEEGSSRNRKRKRSRGKTNEII